MTDTIDTTAITDLVDSHLAAYCEPDTTRRAQLVATAWSADGVLFDPPLDASGHDGLNAVTDVLLAHYPGHTFRRTTGVDAHHGVARYGWALLDPSGAVVLSGLDVADISPDGKLQRVVGFFGDCPAS